MISWGIIGTGKISQDFVASIQQTNLQEVNVIAIGSRSQESADGFAQKFNIANSYPNYDGVWENEDVQIVYIGTIHPTHFEVAKSCLENGKHLLVEKPMTMNVRQFDVLRGIAQEKGLFLMQASWSRYFPCVRRVKALLDEGVLGEIAYVHGNFGFQFENVPRLSENALGGGAILDIGVYLVTFAFILFGKAPNDIHSFGNISNDVDYQTTFIFQYENAHASFSCGFNGEYTNELTIIGTKGSLNIPKPFWCPTKFVLTLKDSPEEEQVFPLPETDHTFNFINSVGLSYEAEYASICIRQGNTESQHEPLSETREVIQTLDTIRKQNGLTYVADETEF